MDDGHIEVLAFDNRDLAQILSHTRSHKGSETSSTFFSSIERVRASNFNQFQVSSTIKHPDFEL